MQTMMLLFLAGLLWFHTALAAITPFQKNISACLKNQVDVVGIKNLDGLYRVFLKSIQTCKNSNLRMANWLYIKCSRTNH